jgi:hypothetical protein
MEWTEHDGYLPPRQSGVLLFGTGAAVWDIGRQVEKMASTKQQSMVYDIRGNDYSGISSGIEGEVSTYFGFGQGFGTLASPALRITPRLETRYVLNWMNPYYDVYSAAKICLSIFSQYWI